MSLITEAELHRLKDAPAEAQASAVMLSKVAYDSVDSLVNMVASSYTSEGVLK